MRHFHLIPDRSLREMLLTHAFGRLEVGALIVVGLILLPMLLGVVL